MAAFAFTFQYPLHWDALLVIVLLKLENLCGSFVCYAFVAEAIVMPSYHAIPFFPSS